MSISSHKEQLDLVDNLTFDLDVIRCGTCGLVQYRTRTGNCRRCVHTLPQHPKFLIPEPSLPREGEVAVDSIPVKLPNRQAVENIGQRIRQLRESRNMTQSQLHVSCRVSRSYLSAH